MVKAKKPKEPKAKKPRTAAGYYRDGTKRIKGFNKDGSKRKSPTKNQLIALRDNRIKMCNNQGMFENKPVTRSQMKETVDKINRGLI